MILIAPDKFKGTFTASEICRLVASRLRAAGIFAPLQLSPLSDGGEGAAGAFMPDAVRLAEGVYEQQGVRLLVSSEIVGFKAFEGMGLPLMQRSSVRLGQAFDPAYPTLIAVGGTATSDAGAGFLQGLGAKFYDAGGRLISSPLCPATLPMVAGADLSAVNKLNIKGIIDVRAALYEGSLSALDFAPQKALPGEGLGHLGAALAHFQRIVGGKSEWDGAGGGLGYAIASVLKAPCISGAEAAIEGLAPDWSKVRLVITGEGCVDAQTVNGGKLVDALFKKASSLGVPTLILYGCAEQSLPYPHLAQLESPWEDAVRELL